MSKLIFVNLPVSDLPRSVAFYAAIGASQNHQFSDDTAACMVLSDVIHVMLLTHAKFSTFTPRPVADARSATEVLLCVSADDRAAVDAMVRAAAGAGGRADTGFNEDHGWMYGRSFEDPDGHMWEVMWMDQAAAAQAMASKEPA